MYYGGMTWTETYNMPVTYKRWLISRITKELTKGGENGESEGSASRALHQNSPEIREMQGRTRSQSPSRLRRFS
jgi:hypothetical protein